VSSVGQAQHRLWAEQLESLLSGRHGSRELTAEQTRRSVIAAYVVLQLHQVNKRGQCRYCWRSTRWPRRRKPCTVYLTFKVAMTQPLKIVLGWMEDH